MQILLGEIMEKKDITYEGLFRICGISTSTLHRIASLQTSPTMNNMEKIAAGLGVRISDLYESEYK